MSVRHPWDKWLKRKKLILIRGRDFRCQPHSMSVMVRNAAYARGIRVSVRIDEDTLTVRRVG